MKSRFQGRKLRSIHVSRDAGIVVGVSVVLSMVALVVFAATLPA